MLSHFILQPPEELEVKLFEAVAVWGDEVEAAVYATINLGGIIITISYNSWYNFVIIYHYTIKVRL